MGGVKGADNPSSKRILLVNTGEIFDSATQLCEKYPQYCLSKVCAICRGDRMSHKKATFRYVDENGEIKETGKPLTYEGVHDLRSQISYNNKNDKVAILDVTNNIKYETALSAVGIKNVSPLLRGLRRNNGEYVFKGIRYKLL